MAELRLSVRVKPSSSRVKVGGSHDGALIVAVNPPPVDGAANEAVIEALAGALGLKARQLRLVSGHVARTKIIAIETDEPDRVHGEISRLTGND